MLIFFMNYYVAKKENQARKNRCSASRKGIPVG